MEPISEKDKKFLEELFQEMFANENKDFVKKVLKRIDTDAGIDVDVALFKAFLITLGGLTDMRVLTGAVMAYEVLARIDARKKE